MTDMTQRLKADTGRLERFGDGWVRIVPVGLAGSDVGAGAATKPGDEIAGALEGVGEVVDVKIGHDATNASAGTHKAQDADCVGSGVSGSEAEVRYVNLGFFFTSGVEGVSGGPEDPEGEADRVGGLHEKPVLLTIVIREDGHFSVMTRDGRVPTFGELQDYALLLHEASKVRRSSLAEPGRASSPKREGRPG